MPVGRLKAASSMPPSVLASTPVPATGVTFAKQMHTARSAPLGKERQRVKVRHRQGDDASQYGRASQEGWQCAHQARGHLIPANAIVRRIGHVKETALAHCQTTRPIELGGGTNAIGIPCIRPGHEIGDDIRACNGGHCATRYVDLADAISPNIGNVGSRGVRRDSEACRFVERCIRTDTVLGCPIVTGNCGHVAGSDDHLPDSSLPHACVTSVKYKEDRTVGIRCTSLRRVKFIFETCEPKWQGLSKVYGGADLNAGNWLPIPSCNPVLVLPKPPTIQVTTRVAISICQIFPALLCSTTKARLSLFARHTPAGVLNSALVPTFSRMLPPGHGKPRGNHECGKMAI